MTQLGFAEVPVAPGSGPLQRIADAVAAAIDADAAVLLAPALGLEVWNATLPPHERTRLMTLVPVLAGIGTGSIESPGGDDPGWLAAGVRAAAAERIAGAGAGAVLAALARGPRRFGPAERAVLRDFAALAGAQIAAADGALAGTRDLVRRASGLVRIGYWQLERGSTRVTWSAEIYRLYGYDAGQPPPTLEMALAAYPQKAQVELRRGLARAFETGEEVTVSTPFTRLDGSRRDVLIRFRGDVGRAGARPRVSGIIMDVTDARALDERLQREKDLLQATLDHMDQGLIVIDPDLSVPVLNRRVAELLSLPPEFADARPSFPEILDYQCESGLIPRELRDCDANAVILEGRALPEAQVYERETFDGRWLEVRTTALPDGGFVRTFTDATARRRREQAVARAEAQYRTLFENAVTGVYRSSVDGRLLRANPALARLHGYASEAELVAAVGDLGREWYVDPERRAGLVRLLLEHGRVADLVSEVYRHRTGERIWVSETAWVIRDEAGAVVGFEGTLVDASERRAAEARIAHMARHDGLTGLPNRLLFGERLAEELARLGDDDEPLALLCLDLDRFRTVNDTLGHPAGDALLAELARRFAGLLRREDLIARLGGDEFAILVRCGRAHDAAETLAARLVAAARAPVEIDGRPVSVGLSVGIALAPAHGRDATQLMKCADVALHRAKREGRDTFRRFAPEMDAGVQRRQRLELDLRGALARREFRLLYQPVVRLADGQVAGYEALLRWDHPLLGAVQADSFIPIAEETRLIGEIGRWVLNRACAEAAGWRDGADLLVNVSGMQLGLGDFRAGLDAALAASGLAPERLVLEITETSLMRGPEDIGALLAGLRRRGIRVALDDFGTGYSSLGHLRRFGFDVLKIDKSFVADLGAAEARAIVQAILDLARRLGIRTIAEGVETEAQREVLRRAGCDMLQGHLTGEPLRPAR